ncbi:MAG: DegT/DnrJ/EryC1/StrS family aminotransferase [Magnetococcus sp. DMHC-6]
MTDSPQNLSSTPKWQVPYIDMRLAFQQHRHALLARMEDVCADARLILRDEVEELEKKSADFLGVDHAIGVGNGSDAIYFALQAAGIGPADEVITVAHTFVATLAAIHRCGATPILVDIDQNFTMDPNQLEKAITPQTRGIIPVHLNGRCCPMTPILKIAQQHNLVVIEDAAQAFGACYEGRHAGSFGLAGAFSFHPMKVLACCGDGGLVTTNDPHIARQIRLLRNHGLENKTHLIQYGYNSRLDTLQAAILLERFDHLPFFLERRRHIARCYCAGLQNITAIRLPPSPEEKNTPYWDIFNSYVIRYPERDRLANHLRRQGVETMAHWWPPLHQQAALPFKNIQLPQTERIAKEVLSLPIYPEMTDSQVDHVIAALQNFPWS